MGSRWSSPPRKRGRERQQASAGVTWQSIVFAKTSGEERWIRGSIAPMAATNKCLAQSNKSRTAREATKKR